MPSCAPTQKIIPGAVINMTYDALLRPTSMKSQVITAPGTSGTAQAPAGAIIHTHGVRSFIII